MRLVAFVIIRNITYRYVYVVCGEINQSESGKEADISDFDIADDSEDEDKD